MTFTEQLLAAQICAAGLIFWLAHPWPWAFLAVWLVVSQCFIYLQLCWAEALDYSRRFVFLMGCLFVTFAAPAQTSSGTNFTDLVLVKSRFETNQITIMAEYAGAWDTSMCRITTVVERGEVILSSGLSLPFTRSVSSNRTHLVEIAHSTEFLADVNLRTVYWQLATNGCRRGCLPVGAETKKHKP